MNSEKIEISVVVPVYGCEGSLDDLLKRLLKVLNPLVNNYEIVFVDDASPDGCWGKIVNLVNDNLALKGIKLSRNFGQHNAITAGLDCVEGEWVVVMDCDLQDDPKWIKELYETAISGYDIVFARRAERKDTYFKKLGSKLFYKLMSYMSNTNLDPAIANYGIYNRKVIESILQMQENFRYFPLMVKWVGFSSVSVDVVHCKRAVGGSSYTFRRLLDLSVDVMMSFSTRPLKLMVYAGFLMSFLATVYALYIIFLSMSSGIEVIGWASVMISIWFLGGVMMMIIGIVGVYIGKVFDEVKSRPKYIVSRVIEKK